MKNLDLPANIQLPQDGQDFFLIYQLSDTADAENLHFRNYDYFLRSNVTARRDLYEPVHAAVLSTDTSLEGIYETFNMNRPDDFHGHSLSVSDVVVLRRNDDLRAFFVDSIGFKEVPDFLT